MKKNTFLWKNEIFDIKMQFSSILRKTIQLDQKWCYLAEIWSRSSQDGNKQFQVAFFLYFEYFSRYGKYRAKNAEILQNLAFFGIFLPKKCHISKNIANINKKLLGTVCYHLEMIFTKFQPNCTIFDPVESFCVKY